MYADKMTESMNYAISETKRRRKIQAEFNLKHGITPTSVVKAIKDQLPSTKEADIDNAATEEILQQAKLDTIPKDELKRIVKRLEEEMKLAAENLDFEYAAQLRDKLAEAKKQQL